MHARVLSAVLILFPFVPPAAAAPPAPPDLPADWFPFVMSPLDNPASSPADVSFLNGGPAARRIASKDGHFFDEAGKRVRFFGVNITFSACFPPKEQAPRIAKRLAQLGFNVVRFHHMDARDIWLPGQAALDPEKLDRLDWFIHCLKENGVYANLNLHVSRTYPGLKEASLPYGYRYGKMVDRFYAPFLELQEAYASALLDRVNPYTKLRVADDPCVAFVEMNNENTLLAMRGESLTGLTEPYRGALASLWRAWLEKRHGTAAAAAKAWNAGTEPLGDELLRNGGFASGLDGWSPQGHKAGACEAAAGAGPGGAPCASFRILKPGAVSYAYQLHQAGLKVEEGRAYTLRFQGRAEPPRDVSVSIRFANDPWKGVAESHSIRLTPEWKEHTCAFRVAGLEPGRPIRLSFNLGDTTGAAEIAAASLRPGRPQFAPPAGEGFAGFDLPAPHWPPAALADFRECLVDVELESVRRIRGHIKDVIRCKSLLCDTQASYGGAWGLRRELAVSDYIDMHAYWQHPRFPGKPWDSKNWNIPNTSMVASADGGTFAKLALYRAAGRPYSVSEYNHPTPNDHAAELFPMLAAFAAAQDWDAVYQFSYLNNDTAIGNGKINGYFELAHHSAQLVFAPIAALLFRGAALEPLAGTTDIRIPLEGMRAELGADWIGPEKWLQRAGVPPAAVLGRRTAASIVEKGAAPVLEPPAAAPAGGRLIDAPGLVWDPAGDAPQYTVCAPAARVAVGALGGRQVQLGDVSIECRLPDKTWACFALASLDAKPVAESSRLLLALATRAENSGMVWNAARTTLSNHWGGAPVIAQGVPAVITLPPGFEPAVTAIGPSGERAATLEVKRNGSRWTIDTAPASHTLWYIIERP